MAEVFPVPDWPATYTLYPFSLYAKSKLQGSHRAPLSYYGLQWRQVCGGLELQTRVVTDVAERFR